LFGSIFNNQLLASAVRGELAEHYVFVTKWGSLGDGNAQFTDAAGIRGRFGSYLQFDNISDVTVGLAGKVYVSDYGKNNVQVFGLS
jgi:hypothetical protein